jgi:hypothetical protein
MSRLERWSRLKRNVETQEEASVASQQETATINELPADPGAVVHDEAGQPEAESERPQAPPAPAPEPGSLDHTLPDPETLQAGSDFSAYMVPGVSGALRRQALKRLWATGNYNVRDGLDDYDADYHKLLKPMSSELAGKLRQWTHKVEEAVDKQVAETQPEGAKDIDEQDIDDQETPLSADDRDSRPNDSSLDDQSDYLSGGDKNT